mmetsp:Transcript_33430/g.46694  ORF Transcript_33430/g.46694 Transcript_33430/m.46694 type:complete len:128 (-) Transcript_33430:79-462(-)
MATSASKRMEDSHSHLVSAEDGLRKVEVDVVIPKLMKKAAIKKCDDVVQAFTACCKGRTVSILWACREVNDALDKCLRENMTDHDFLRAKEEFIKLRTQNPRNKNDAGNYAENRSFPQTNAERVGGI